MNKGELIATIATNLREAGARKPVRSPKKVFHISDDEGNSKDFIMQVTDKTVNYTKEDVETILNAFIDVVLESLKEGEPVSIRSFGTFGLRFHKGRRVKHVYDGSIEDVPSNFYPRFSPAKDIKMSARIYSQMLRARGIDLDEMDSTETDGSGD